MNSEKFSDIVCKLIPVLEELEIEDTLTIALSKTGLCKIKHLRFDDNGDKEEVTSYESKCVDIYTDDSRWKTTYEKERDFHIISKGEGAQMYRNGCMDEPERDWERYNEDNRPVIGYCELCGCELHGEDEHFDRDTYYNFGNLDGDYFVCEDCLDDYTDSKKVRG